MLPRASRLNASEDFRTTIRRGVRVGRPTLVLHVAAAPADAGVRVGFVVSKAVGNAVTRNRVKRRLRHLAAEQLVTLRQARGTGGQAQGTASAAQGVDVVVRALPPSASAGADLAGDLTSAWVKARRRLG